MANAGAPRVGAIGAYPELVFHGLAHLSLQGPSNLFEPRYVEWVRRSLPRQAFSTLAADASLIAARHASSDDPLAFESFVGLHQNGAGLRRAAAKPFAALSPEDVASPAALQGLTRGDSLAMEVFHADLALASQVFETIYESELRPHLDAVTADVSAALVTASEALPALVDVVVELSHALGPRGRGLSDRIVVGAPATWNAMTPRTSAVLVCHEHAVAHATSVLDPGLGFLSGYARAEWAALVQVAQGLCDTSLAADHASWLERLHLQPLCELAVREQLVDSATAQRLADDGPRRAAVLAAAPPLPPFA